MSDPIEEPRPGALPPEARRSRSRWPGLIWALPLAAVIIVAYLGIQSFAHRGVKVVVTFSNAAGAQVGDTKVIYLGAAVGHVSKIEISKDGRNVDLTLRLTSRTRSVLNSHTRFWLIGAKPSLTDIASVKAALTGLAIGMSPGVGGRPTDHFIGLDAAPVIEPGERGSDYVLESDDLGSFEPGAALLYHGQPIGKVTATRFLGPGRFRIDVFVLAAFEGLIRPDTMFWVGDPLSVSLNSQGLSTKLESPSSLLSGAVDIDMREPGTTIDRSPAGAHFTLYKSKGDAQRGAMGPGVLYSLKLDGSAGDLSQGASVKLAGYTVGEVESARLAFKPGSAAAYTAAVVVLYPMKLQIAGPVSSDPLAWRGPADAAVQRLLQHGYRARLVQSPALIGSRAIELAQVKGAGPGQLGAGDYPLIPSAAAPGDIGDLTTQADEILTKVNQIPIAQIGQDVRGITSRLSALASSPKTAESLNHLASTLRQVDEITTAAKPQVGPLVAKLREAADQMSQTAAAARAVLAGDGAAQDEGLPSALKQLSEAATSMRSLADYLQRHPESLLRGKGKDKP